MLNSRAVDGHQMYFGGSVVSKAIDLSNPSVIFTKVEKFEIWRRSKHITQL